MTDDFKTFVDKEGKPIFSVDLIQDKFQPPKMKEMRADKSASQFISEPLIDAVL